MRVASIRWHEFSPVKHGEKNVCVADRPYWLREPYLSRRATCYEFHTANYVAALATSRRSSDCYLVCAQATTVCVDNETDLVKELKDYSDGGIFNGDALEIHLVGGKFYNVGTATGNHPFTYFSTASTGTLVIQGGWNADCTQQSANLPAVLDGKNIASVLKLDNNTNGIFLLQLYVQNGQSTTPGGGMSINAVASSRIHTGQAPTCTPLCSTTSFLTMQPT